MKRFGILFGLLIYFSVSLLAQQPQLQPLPIDPKIRYGKLDNGLTYYIRHNEEPKQRAEFYIVQKVGAILENDDQNGLAHFLEHMSFNGTKHFPDKGIINFLEKHGVKFGENINAYTSLDETVYNLSNVPTTQEGVIDTSLLVLHDWSHSLSLLDSEIDAERGVIREEWRQGANADRRMWKESNKQKFPGSQYSKRDVIGDTAVINNFKYQTLRDYYAKWYRPDLQGIIVVGDVDVDKVEAKIKSAFADIPKPVNPAERVIYKIDDNKDPIVAVVTDPEARMTRLELEYKHDKLPAEVKLSSAGYYVYVVNQLISSIMAERFDEITNQADAPFVGAFAYYGELVKSKDAFDMIAIPKEGKELEGLKALLLEAEKMKRFGFTPSELERAKTNFLKNTEKAYNERDNQKNSSLVREYIGNFLDNEPIPGIEFEYNTIKTMLPNINLDVVNQLAKRYVTDENLIVTVMAPEKEAVKVPSKEMILAAIQESKDAKIEAKKDEAMNKPLMENAPKAGTVKKITQNAAMETTEMLLSNGVKVIFKPTTFKKDEILMSAFSDGGNSKVHNLVDLPSAAFAASVVSNNGIGNFSQTDLSKILTGKIASVNPYISNYEEGMSGNSSVADLETLLQLTYLYFTAPRKDDNAFGAMMNMYRTSLANSMKNPSKAFSDSINETLSDHDPRTILMTPEIIDKINQDKSIEIYKQRFANPADFTFMFVGNIDPQNKETQKLLATYLGGLKTTKVKEKWDDVDRHTPKGKINNYFEKEMKVQKASNFIYYSGAMPYSIQNKIAVEAIGSILRMRYTESIREKEGGSYGVGVRGSVSNTPEDKAALMMQFDTDPEKQVKLMGIIHSEVEEIMKNGPRQDDLSKVKENMLKKYAEDIEQNNWWKSTLKDYYQDKLNYRTDYKAAVEALNSDLIQKTLKSIVDQGNVIEVVMKPAK
ncbi:Peptidase M16 domain protein [uncultured Paludibacter sp.]|uniref:Peptidase M16 domain protein n=1 Tax=uncultured Paludibacter sp. TaxID=497635 RepID=A0A653AGF3_9BACT|nr:Peptidase M16 domain protein [uncultured Paludibacter sp.]